MSCGAETEANSLMTSLMTGEDLSIPVFDVTGIEFDLPGGVNNPLYNEIEKLKIEDLTTRVVDGAGAFDALMAGVKAHLKEEFIGNRITGAEYSKTYTALTQAVIGGAVQFLLGKDQAYWAAVQGQLGVVTGKIQMKIAATELALTQYKARSMRAEYALNKLRLASESQQFCVAKFNLEEMLPKQSLMLTAQMEGVTAQTMLVGKQALQIIGQTELGVLQGNLVSQQVTQSVAETLRITNQSAQIIKQTLQIEAQTSQIAIQSQLITQQIAQSVAQTNQIGVQSQLITQQIAQSVAQIGQMNAQTFHIQAQTEQLTIQSQLITQQIAQSAAQVLQIGAQTLLIKEQYETARAATLDQRSDQINVAGSIGKQKDLYTQQITSYKRDSEYKVGKLFTDGAITQMTLLDGEEAPSAFSNATVDGVMNALRAANGF